MVLSSSSWNRQIAEGLLKPLDIPIWLSEYVFMPLWLTLMRPSLVLPAQMLP